MRLADLQSALDAALAGKDRPDLQNLVCSLHRSPNDCIALYRGLLRDARARALRERFPACAAVLGSGHFQHLADLYSEQLAAGATADPFGVLLPDLIDGYCTAHPDLHHLSFLSDLTTLEWNLHLARGARDDPAIDLQAWASLPESEQNRMRAITSYSLSLQHSQWPLSEIRAAVLAQQPWQPALANKGGWLCVHRQLDRLCIERITEEQAMILNGLRQGLNLDQIGDDLRAIREQLPLMIARGWVCRLQHPPDGTPSEDN
ncbi:MAG: putative DNA-binding domain-containing protein [Oceanospirillaceae bacterium]|nr:putative DNA-binding domain-containing protein [Oceanospirillaceae bacterium]